MELIHEGVAGTMESGDIFVEIAPADTLTIALESTVERQFARQIRAVIADTLRDCGVAGAEVRAVDKGALDCTIRARITAAACRAADRSDMEWR